MYPTLEFLYITLTFSLSAYKKKRSCLAPKHLDRVFSIQKRQMIANGPKKEKVYKKLIATYPYWYLLPIK